MGSARFDRKILPWLLLAPALLVVFGLVVYPVGRTVWLSFRSAGLPYLASGQSRFVGLENYRHLLTDAHLREVFLTTAGFGFACVAATMAAGLAVALLLDQPFRGRALLGVLVLLPWAVPRVAAGVVWRWMFDDQYGLVNWTLSHLGHDFSGFSWFNDRWPAFIAVGVVVVWQSFPFVALSLLAGLQSIPPEVKEAARMDGAGPLQMLRHITLPMLRPLLLTLVVVSTIWDFKIFDQVYVMTGGGPYRSTELVAITVWREAFARLHLGTAAALAVALFAVLLVMTIGYGRLARDEVPAVKRRPAATVAIYAAAVVIGLFAVAPFAWMFLTSIKPDGEIFSRTPSLWTASPQFGRYVDVLDAGFATALRNSLIVATGTTVAGVAVAALAGYALARFDIPLRRYLLLMVMGVQMFPLVVLIIPLFVVMKALGLLDSWVGLIVAYLSFTTPLAVWLLRSFFETIPKELEEAAMSDGATRFGAMVRVIFPLAGPGLAATAIFSFIAAWNEFLFALTFLKKESLRTLPVALSAFVGQEQADWGAIMAGSVMFTIPVVIFFLAVHKRLTTGMVAGSVTG